MNKSTDESGQYQTELKALMTQLEDMLPADKFAVFNRDAEQFAKDYPTPLKARVGDIAADFDLPNPQGDKIALSQLIESGPVVLTFYRGAWCPYCNLELRLYQSILPQIHAAGGSLVAISPMTPDNSLSLQEQNALAFHVLSDVHNNIARHYTTVFKNSASSIQAMTDLGYDFYGFYADDSAEIPIPATFVINQQGVITFAQSAGGDYRQRVEPQLVLDALVQKAA